MRHGHRHHLRSSHCPHPIKLRKVELSAYLPLTGGASHPTVRRHTLVVAHWLEADVEPIETLPSPVPAVALDPGYVREPVHVHLAKGEQRQEGYLALNPQGLMPLLEDGKARISQSLAIIEYFERTRPEPPLLPGDPVDQARVRSLALVCACEMHPLNNLCVLKYLQGPLGLDQAMCDAWCRHWIEEGFAALERRLASEPETGRFCHGDRPTLADVCLVPQVVSSKRWGTDLGPYPTVRRIHDACLEIEAFVRAMPANQPDAE